MITTILQIAGGIAGVVLLFFLAIMIHEYGHFIVARRLGFKVDAFSICFGPAIWKKKVNGVEYRIGCIPLGGYVALPQLDPSSMDVIQGGHKEDDKAEDKGEKGDADAPSASAPPMAAWKRVLVALAGPAGNVVLAIALALLIGAFAPKSDFGGEGTVIGAIKGERAEACGIRAGDEIVAIAGRRVSFWSDVVIECHLAGDAEEGLQATVMRDGKETELTLPVKKDDDSGFLRLDGITPWLDSEVADIAPESPAANSSIMRGDRVATINGKTPTSPMDAVDIVREAGTNEVTLVVERAARRGGPIQTLTFTLLPKFDEELGRHIIGIAFSNPAAAIPQWMTYRNPWRQLTSDANSIFRMLGALIAPKAKGEQKRAASGMGGPGTLLFILWNEVHKGFFRSMGFLRFLCINLAIINLLPLPVLDGGHILFALVEIVTRRRPSRKFVEYVTTAFAVLLIALMALLMARDAIRIHKFVSREAAEESSER